MTKKITNEQIFELLQKQEQNFEVLQRDTAELKKEVIDARLDQRSVRRAMDLLQDYALTSERRLNVIERKIDEVKITWNTRLVSGILGTSVVASGVVTVLLLKFIV